MKHKSTPLNITAAVEEFAIAHGAYFVENEGWFVDGEVPIELEEFVIQEQRIRDYVAESQEKINFEPAVAAKKTAPYSP
ncbi:hypothetical protein HEAR0402 [Herminiimonas arsenicoxydans]|uniref:Uncharacterized protein n=1 Tax=Herminiimonas arsenicoxydans TaxID=204773 RepID=A4G286_HERAR|nr:hypothetical protein HEAR0402 [Herminiimonas arsenicoxydans]